MISNCPEGRLTALLLLLPLPPTEPVAAHSDALFARIVRLRNWGPNP